MKWLAAPLLLLGLLRHYGWVWAPPESARFVWNLSGSVVIVIFLWSLAYQFAAARPIVIWWSFEELQVIACSLARILRFWEVKPGESQCSALLGFDLGSVGLMLAAIVLYKGFHSKPPGSSYGYKSKGGKP